MEAEITTEYLPPSLQESILAALVYDERAGAAIAAQVSPQHFDDTYRDIAVRVLDYRRRYGRGPGRSHLDDLFGKALAGGRTPRLRRLLFDLAALADGLNGDYVISRTQEFIREQTLKGALQEAAARYEQGGDNVATDIETILSRSLRQRTESLDAGTFLNDPSRAFKFLDAQADGIKLGIEALDNTGFRLSPREQLLYIAPKGCLTGETLVDCPRDLRQRPHGIPIKDLVGKKFWTYSWDFDKGRPVLSWVSDVWCSGRKPTYRVVLSAGVRERYGRRVGGGVTRARYLPPTELVGTYDHPVLLSDGSWRKLGELRPGDSVMSLYRKAESRGSYCKLSWTSDSSCSVREHRFVCEELAPEGAVFDRSVHVHHKDGNAANNSPENLEALVGRQHLSNHLRDRNLEGTVGWQKMGVHPKGMLGKLHSLSAKERQRAASAELARGRKRRSNGTFEKAPNHKVVSVEFVGEQLTYDMAVERTNNFVANGVFVHNSGKTWLCVHVGAQGLLQTQKVLHLSLEWPEEKVAGRYYQRLFAAGMKSDEFMQALLTVDDNGSLTGFRMRRVAPKWSLAAQGSRKELSRRVKLWGRRLGRVVIKSFPSGSLTMSQLEGYLDYLEAQHKFIPTVLIVDYPDLMAQDAKNLRVTIGRTFVDLRGLAHKRNLALFTPTQGNRGALSARQVRASAASEDITKVFTADTVMTYSRTEAEKERGLARLFLEHTRNMADGLEFVITQSYNTGQYVLSSMQATPAYFDQVEAVGGAKATEGSSEDSGDW